MHDFLINLLQCPLCRGELDWNVAERRGERIERAEAICRQCSTRYPVREGIGLFLTPDLPRDDLWEQVNSQLGMYLNEHPEIERQLMQAPTLELSPADQFLRALVLEERGDFEQAKNVAEAAFPRLYTSEFLDCAARQIDHAIDSLGGSSAPIVDFASGRGYLVERLATRLTSPIVASDFSPRVLRRDRKWFRFLGVSDQISLLCFDARRTPFKEGAIELATSYLGLANISEPDRLIPELRRIVNGQLLAISHFYPEDDAANAGAIRQMGMDTLLFRRSAIECFAFAGWNVRVSASCTGKAAPTPKSEILGISIDGLPVAETLLDWCTLVAQ